MPRLDLTTQRFGQLTVISENCIRNGNTYWDCLCDCGKLKITCTSNLRNGHTKHCGCIPFPPRKHRDLTDFRTGMLTVLEIADHKRWGKLTWKCICACGNLYYGISVELALGIVQSCGCQEGGPTHRLSRTPAYCAIKGAWHRCENPDSRNYNDYGGRGIKVCQRWHDPVAFHNDMGQPPDGMSLDRINNDGNYSCGKCSECIENEWPMNCRWADGETQHRNQRSNHWITANGKTMTMIEWRIETGLAKSTIINRLNRGWSEQDAVTKPAQSKHSRYPLVSATEGL